MAAINSYSEILTFTWDDVLHVAALNSCCHFCNAYRLTFSHQKLFNLQNNVTSLKIYCSLPLEAICSLWCWGSLSNKTNNVCSMGLWELPPLLNSPFSQRKSFWHESTKHIQGQGLSVSFTLHFHSGRHLEENDSSLGLLGTVKVHTVHKVFGYFKTILI